MTFNLYQVIATSEDGDGGRLDHGRFVVAETPIDAIPLWHADAKAWLWSDFCEHRDEDDRDDYDESFYNLDAEPIQIRLFQTDVEGPARVVPFSHFPTVWAFGKLCGVQS